MRGNEGHQLFHCHSERSEESVFALHLKAKKQIPRCARNDTRKNDINFFFLLVREGEKHQSSHFPNFFFTATFFSAT
jgi:hypothetical protein